MNEEFIDSYIKTSKENIFLAMQLSKMSYPDIMLMPVHRLTEYLEWKIKYDRDVAKLKTDKLEQI